MAHSSYDELIKQVESLKAENLSLKQELADNSNHLSKLEIEAVNMKEVLAKFGESTTVAVPGDRIISNYEEQLRNIMAPCNKNGTIYNHIQNFTLDSYNGNVDFSQISAINIERSNFLLQQLYKERGRILLAIESEENERRNHFNELQLIEKEIENLSENGDEQRDQLSAKRTFLKSNFEHKIGIREEMVRRDELRLRNLKIIDKKIAILQQHGLNEMDGNRQDGLHVSYQSAVGGTSNHVSNSQVAPPNDSVNEMSSSTDRLSIRNSIMTSSGTQTGPSCDADVVGNPSSSFCHGTWPVDRVSWHSGPSSIGEDNSSLHYLNNDAASVMSFNSSMSSSMSTRRSCLGTKMEMVYSLLSMLSTHDKEDMSKTLLKMSTSQDSCIAMIQSGCLPLLVQLLHGGDKDLADCDTRGSQEARRRACEALHNIVHAHPNDKRGRREAQVLRLLELIRKYCDNLIDAQNVTDDEERKAILSNTVDRHPGNSIAVLMKLSFDEEHRHAIYQLGGLQAIAELIQVDYEVYGNGNDQHHVTLRRYAGMALTNLTFGDGTNKALLCSMKSFMRALVAQLHSPSEDLRQVTASVLRNLSWRADLTSKRTLREIGAVTNLMKVAIEANKESTLKSVLSALWNLSAHCSMNKSDICAVDGALAFMIGTLTYKSPSKTLSIVENGGGILRNVSSHIAVNEQYREILRQHNCLQILLQHLKSPSLSIVSNACGTLWNLSARSAVDQKSLWEMGAISMLKNLVHSKHKMISMGSSAALKNLLAAKPAGMTTCVDQSNKSGVPSLHVRKQKALVAELDQSLSETCDNIDSPKNSPTTKSDDEPRFVFDCEQTRRGRLLDRQMVHDRMYHSLGPVSHFDSSSDVGRQVPRSNSINDGGGISDPVDQALNRHRSLEFHHHRHSRMFREKGRRQSPSPIRPNSNGQRRHDDALFQSGPSLQLIDVASYDRILTTPPGSLRKEKARQSTPKDFEEVEDASCEVQHLNFDENDERPVDYAVKYRNESDAAASSSGEPKRSNGSVPRPKINNYVSPVKDSSELICLQLEQSKLGKPASATSSFGGSDPDDCDQPTDFSLKYTEDSDEPVDYKGKTSESVSRRYPVVDSNGCKQSAQEDTVKTYCVEGTPLNFSTASSMTDLRVDVTEPKNGLSDESPKPKISKSYVKDCQIEEADPDEAPVSYCVEDTPACFSRVSSLSSIGEGGDPDDVAPLRIVENGDVRSSETLVVDRNSAKVKSVKFGGDAVGVQDTPMMFSRSSSMESLSSCDQHSMCDDRSSVVSEYSRRTSRAISPSELPDSPSQTMPPSPSRRHSVRTTKTDTYPDGVFKDDTKQFAVEDTPAHLSTATSLSDLVADHDGSDFADCAKDDSRDKDRSSTNVESDESRAEHSSVGNEEGDREDHAEEEIEEDEEQGEDALLLAACISSAMPNNNKNSLNNNSKLSSKVNKLNNASLIAGHTSPIPIKSNNLKLSRPMPNKAGDRSLIPVKSINRDRRNNNDDRRSTDAVKLFDADKTGDSFAAEPRGFVKGNDGSSCDNFINEFARGGLPAPKLQKQAVKYPSPLHGASSGASLNFSFTDDRRSSDDGKANRHSDASPGSLSFNSDRVGRPPALNLVPGDQIPDTCNADQFTLYAVEGTPMTFSRRDSESALGYLKECYSDDSKEIEDTPAYNSFSSEANVRVCSYDSGSVDEVTKYTIEDTPDCFSRNSPLSLSLDAEDSGVANVSGVVSTQEGIPTQAEQDLLDKCISSVLPKKHESIRAKKSRLPRAMAQSGHGKNLVTADDPDQNRNARTSEVNLKNDPSHLRLPIEVRNNRAQDKSSSKMQSSGDKFGSEGSASWTDESPNANEFATLQSKLSNVGVDDSRSSPSGIPCDVNSLLSIEAKRIADRVTEDAEDLSASCTSDLERINPPSVMNDLITGSMCSSITSDFSNSLSCVSNNQFAANDKGDVRTKFVLPRQRNHNSLISSADMLENIRTPSIMGSVDNLSLRSNVENIDDINPPSAMENVSLASLNSRSGNAGPGMRDGVGDVAVNTTNSCNSEMLENTKPPSCFQEISDAVPGAQTDTLSTGSTASDTEIEEELPHDDEESTVQSKTDSTANTDSNERCNTSLDRCNTALSGDVAMDDMPDDVIQPTPSRREDENDVVKEGFTADEMNFLEADANLVVCSLNEGVDQTGNEPMALNAEILIDDETISLVSNESDSDNPRPIDAMSRHVEEPPTENIPKRPRIIKPVERPVIRPKRDEDVGPKPIRGRRKPLTGSRISNAKVLQTNVAKPVLRPKMQNKEKKNVAYSKFRTANDGAGFVCTFHNQASKAKTAAAKSHSSAKENCATKTKPNSDAKRPRPPVKQGTFTKDDVTSVSNSKTVVSKCNTAVSRPSKRTRNSEVVPTQNTNVRLRLESVNTPNGSKRTTKVFNRDGTKKFGEDASQNRTRVANKTRYTRTPSLNSLSSRGSVGSLHNSSSNFSLKSCSPTGTGIAVPKKEVKSKIASIWKKESSKSVDQATSSNKSKLTRSSTYEKIPELIDHHDEPTETATGSAAVGSKNGDDSPAEVKDTKTNCGSRPANGDDVVVGEQSPPSLERHNSFIRLDNVAKVVDVDSSSSSESSTSSDFSSIRPPMAAAATSKIPTPTRSIVDPSSPFSIAVENKVPKSNAMPKRFCMITNL